MADDDGENDQCTKDNRSNNNVNPDLFDAVKQSSMKIKLLVDGQREIMKQLQLLTEKLLGLTPQNGDDNLLQKTSKSRKTDLSQRDNENVCQS